MVMAGTRRGRDDWADAALDALAEGGLAAIAVEPLAVRLGTTKGSFYWHFANRDELVAAAVDRWERRYTDAIIDRLTPIADPAERLDALLAKVMGDGPVNRAELALLAHADHPAVAQVLARVTERRVGFMTTAYQELGCPPTQARHRAILAYTLYIGLVQAQRATGGALLPDEDRLAYLRLVARTLAL